MEYFVLVILLVLFALETAAVFLPLLPDTVFFWTAVLLYRFVFADVNYSLYFWIGSLLITALILSADYISNVYFIKKQGGSRNTVLTALLAMFFGVLFFGPIGFIVLPFLSIFLLEYWKSRNREDSLKLAFSSIFAFFASTFVRFMMQMFLIIWFFIEIY